MVNAEPYGVDGSHDALAGIFPLSRQMSYSELRTHIRDSTMPLPSVDDNVNLALNSALFGDLYGGFPTQPAERARTEKVNPVSAKLTSALLWLHLQLRAPREA